MVESITIVTIFIISYVILFLLSKPKYSFSNYLYLIYLITFVFSLIYQLKSKIYNVKIFPSIYLYFILLMWIYPFKYLKYDISIKNKNYEFKFKIYGIISSLITFYFAYYAIKSILNTPIAAARLILSSSSILPLNTFTYLGIIFQSIYYINIILFFISLIHNYSAKTKTLLLIGSLSNTFYVLCFFGRDGIIYWMLNYFALYYFFSKKIKREIKKRLIAFNITSFIILVMLFLFITYSRFSYGKDNPLNKIYSNIVEYGGQQLGNFSDGFKYDIRDGSLFPQIERALNRIIPIKNKNDKYDSFNTAGLEEEKNVFGYFVKSFIFITGKNVTIIISIILFFIVIILCNLKNNLSKFIIIYTLFQIPLCGLFYYRQAVSYFDYSYLFSIVFSLLFY